MRESRRVVAELVCIRTGEKLNFQNPEASATELVNCVTYICAFREIGDLVDDTLLAPAGVALVSGAPRLVDPYRWCRDEG